MTPLPNPPGPQKTLKTNKTERGHPRTADDANNEDDGKHDEAPPRQGRKENLLTSQDPRSSGPRWCLIDRRCWNLLLWGIRKGVLGDNVPGIQ